MKLRPVYVVESRLITTTATRREAIRFEPIAGFLSRAGRQDDTGEEFVTKPISKGLEVLEVPGSGRSSRCHLYRDDACRGFHDDVYFGTLAIPIMEKFEGCCRPFLVPQQLTNHELLE